jgi:diguanylate cyclase (GGDEF)-like protein
MSMTDRAPASTVARGARLLAWVALPGAALGALRLFDPLVLTTGQSEATSWLLPAACAFVAIAGALRGDGSLARILDAAGAGALAAAAGTVALQGPGASAGAPAAVLGLALVATAVPLVAAGLVGPVGLEGTRARVAGVVGVFAWVEVAPVVGLLLGSNLASSTTAAAAVASGLAVVAAAGALAGGGLDRVGWIAGLASGAAAVAAARTGTADVLPGMLALGAALTGMTVWLATSQAPTETGSRRLPGAPDHAATPDREPLTAPADGLEAEIQSLERELRATIAELLAARQTIALQRSELEQVAEIDLSTRVSSRNAILARLHTEAAEARRYSHPIALVLVDLDGLTELNRSHGLEVGDVVLAELALRLRTRIREADALGRVTGDTFLAILPHTDERGATVFANAVRSRLTARPVQSNAGPVTMTVSIGITVVHPGIGDGDDNELLGRAEEALNSARAAGGNRIAFDRSHGLARLDERRRDEPSTDEPGDRRVGEPGRRSRGEDERPA